MALDWKLVIDCAEPLRLAEFWEAALGYRIEDHGPIIQNLLDQGLIDVEDFLPFRDGKVWRDLAAVRHPDDPVEPSTGTGLGRRLLFQAVPEPKLGKNRLHIDVHAAPGDRESEVRRLTALGARVLRTVSAKGGEHVTMADPEDNEFDVR
ncbi:hypothetical protein E0L36_02040 [Streptomyces sp. AJS327]|uniref:VOC family protein n=1 Tax=Streptomyces sp. AJS327 TaxID=2545265 RepID=UPI0015DFA04B|nr:VOC family protein [Streptomyces sp. AJS327]MBA0049725.1 hypothetical protein [Streptomyces sp. AJS327]